MREERLRRERGDRKTLHSSEGNRFTKQLSSRGANRNGLSVPRHSHQTGTVTCFLPFDGISCCTCSI